MRFCQSDGTPLVEDAPPIDPYKTMVARPEDMTAATGDKDEVLELPNQSDPRKTMVASEDEIRREMGASDEQVIDIPPLVEDTPPEPPKFREPDLSPPSFGSPPPSPFSQTTPPIPSPFEEKKASSYEQPVPPRYAEQEPTFNPFDQPAGQYNQPLQQAEWAPPPAPDSSWQNQDIGQNTPFQPPRVAAGGQNQTLAIVSLVLGILSIICCGVLTGIPALITGFMAKNKAEQNPVEFGGRGMALAGMITGGIGIVLGILGIIYYIFVFSTMNF